MFVLSPSVEATKASARSIPASSSASISSPVPTVNCPPKSSQASRARPRAGRATRGPRPGTKPRGPSASIARASDDPTRPTPTIRMNTDRIYLAPQQRCAPTRRGPSARPVRRLLGSTSGGRRQQHPARRLASARTRSPRPISVRPRRRRSRRASRRPGSCVGGSPPITITSTPRSPRRLDDPGADRARRGRPRSRPRRSRTPRRPPSRARARARASSIALRRRRGVERHRQRHLHHVDRPRAAAAPRPAPRRRRPAGPRCRRCRRRARSRRPARGCSRTRSRAPSWSAPRAGTCTRLVSDVPSTKRR